MIRCALIAVAIGLSSFGDACAAPIQNYVEGFHYLSGNKLLEWCRSKDLHSMCMAYIVGVVDGITSALRVSASCWRRTIQRAR